MSRGDLDFDAISKNLTKLLNKQPQLAISIMEQLREAYGEDLIDATSYARLKKIVAAHANVADGGDETDDRTAFGAADSTLHTSADATQFDDDVDSSTIAQQARAALTAATEDSSLDFDLTGDSVPSDGSWPTSGSEIGAASGGQSSGDAVAEAKIEPGSILKDRFQLDEVLGVGGMGTVFRGRDLIKVEARDRNPYVALKVLNEDFKKHPDSFIALQREASRQQKLAHPNIATVYDFDRTRGGTVFLTMELLEGEPINTFIKKNVRPKGGLPFEEAFPMIEGLGKALIYAHEHNIVHSDFKPGNCFQTKEGVMKVLDFGIARAVKNPGQAEGEKTLFDAAELGALTPAYASAEMMEGEEPDPRDDLYALACVAYELLTGKHPFNKLPANSARDNNLIPQPVKGLKRRQLKGLMRGLAFARGDRSQSVAQFLEELEGRTSPFRNPFIMVPAAIVVIGLAGVAPALNYMHEREIETQIELVKSGDLQQVDLVLETLNAPEFDPADRDRILVAARTEILQYFQHQVDQRVDVEAGQYNFVGANAVIDRVAAMDVFKDSAQVKELRESIANAESVLLNDQTVLFNEALAANHLLPIEGKDDVHDPLAVIGKFSPRTAEQLRRRLPGHFAAAIDRALVNSEFKLANELGMAGLNAVPGNKNLDNLMAKIEGEEARATTARNILNATARIQEAMAGANRLAAFLPVQEDVRKLSRIDPDNELLKALARKVSPLVDKDIAAVSRSKNWAASDLVQNDYKDLLLSLGMRDKDARGAKLRNEFDAEVAKIVTEVGVAVAANQMSPPANPNAATLVTDLESIAPGHTRTLEARSIAARGYLDGARRARATQDFSKAEGLLVAAEQIAGKTPVIASLEVERGILIGDKASNATGLEQRIADRKTQFDEALPSAEQSFGALETSAGAITMALARFDSLVSLSPLDDRLPGLKDQLVSGIGNATTKFGAEEQWDEAVQVVRATLAYLPDSKSLSSDLVTFEAKQREAALEANRLYVANAKKAVETLLADPTANRQWSDDIQRNMADIQILAEGNDPWVGQFKNKIAVVFITKATAAREDERFAEGANLLERAERYAPELEALRGERVALASATEAFEREQREQERLVRTEGLKQDFETQAKANDVASATKTLEQLKRELGDGDAFVTKTGPRMIADAYYKLATKKAEQHDYAAALKLAKAGLKLQPHRQELRLAVKDYTVDGNKQELAKTFGRGDDFDLAEVLEKISDVQTLDPRAYSESESAWAQAVAIRLQSLQKSIGEQSNTLLIQAKEVFAGNTLIASIADSGPVITEAPPSATAIKAAMDAALLGKARDLIKALPTEDAKHAAIVQLKGAYNARIKNAKKLYESYKSAFSAKDYEKANATIDEALGLWGDSTTFKKEKSRVLAALNRDPLVDSGGAIIEPPPPPPTKPCTTQLAGHGKRKKGTCFDFVASGKPGPFMVVVPSGANFAQPYAIGKYEITVGDFNNFCKSKATCSVVTDRERNLPMTGISIDQANEYVTWLSNRTGKNYRLPTVEEWTYAAEAGGQQPRKDYNCRVEQSGQVLKGQSTMGVNTGKANGWGLYNYVGNAQEWVNTGGGVVARGGAFEDTFSKCAISLEKPHGGTPDASTGFRVLLELG